MNSVGNTGAFERGEAKKREMIMTDKAARILEKMKERDRHTPIHWKPYKGPPDWNFIVLDVPKKEVQEEVGQGEKISPL
jgi:hypothetical protein